MDTPLAASFAFAAMVFPCVCGKRLDPSGEHLRKLLIAWFVQQVSDDRGTGLATGDGGNAGQHPLLNRSNDCDFEHFDKRLMAGVILGAHGRARRAFAGAFVLSSLSMLATRGIILPVVHRCHVE